MDSDFRHLHFISKMDDELLARFVEAKETAEKFQNGELTLRK